ncbi:fibronectin type III domain protein [Secundilactobacillus pentosiphilus]|uniref:Fibronectin type III domain protein n=1 Tax=Secundilactobacillus pentosiphilus TaxID=1714682 RepID=A0A1Z5IQX5_9LACO|nr:fibronectin type III domain-containing protein [Secundilactobacillus pentosiphilus]GAX04076.1 fibronectin type III domain protein [Secundilactobacillus pentosiphilus]
MADKTYDILDDKGNVKASAQPAPITVSGLSASTTYSGWHARYTGENILQALADFTTKATQTALAKPSAPTIAVTAGDGSANYTITDATATDEKVSSFKVLYQADGGTDWQTSNITDPTKLTGSISGLTNAKKYNFKAVATNATGDSDESAVVSATPVAPLAKPTAPTIAVTAGDGSADYTITDANISKEQVSSLKVLYQADGGTDWTTVNVADPTKLTGTVKSLTNGTAYDFKAIATNATGDSPESAVVKVTPAAPTAPASTTGTGTSK